MYCHFKNESEQEVFSIYTGEKIPTSSEFFNWNFGQINFTVDAPGEAVQPLRGAFDYNITQINPTVFTPGEAIIGDDKKRTCWSVTIKNCVKKTNFVIYFDKFPTETLFLATHAVTTLVSKEVKCECEAGRGFGLMVVAKKFLGILNESIKRKNLTNFILHPVFYKSMKWSKSLVLENNCVSFVCIIFWLQCWLHKMWNWWNRPTLKFYVGLFR